MSYIIRSLINHLVNAKPLLAYLLKDREKEAILDKYDGLIDEIISAIEEINEEGGDTDARSDMAD